MDDKGFLTLSDTVKRGWKYGLSKDSSKVYEINFCELIDYDQRLLKSELYGPTMCGPWFDFEGKKFSERNSFPNKGLAVYRADKISE